MSVRLLLTEEAWGELAPILTAMKSRAGSPLAHVQGGVVRGREFCPVATP